MTTNNTHTILTVRRPSGNVETVRVEYAVLPGVFAKIQAATKAAGKGDVLSYEVVAEPVVWTKADEMYDMHDSIVRTMTKGEGR